MWFWLVPFDQRRRVYEHCVRHTGLCLSGNGQRWKVYQIGWYMESWSVNILITIWLCSLQSLEQEWNLRESKKNWSIVPNRGKTSEWRGTWFHEVNSSTLKGKDQNRRCVGSSILAMRVRRSVKFIIWLFAIVNEFYYKSYETHFHHIFAGPCSPYPNPRSHSETAFAQRRQGLDGHST